MAKVSPADSIALIKGQTLDQTSAIGLGANVPIVGTVFADVVAAACCINFQIVASAGASTVASNLGNMNLPIMSSSKKSMLMTLVISLVLNTV